MEAFYIYNIIGTVAFVTGVLILTAELLRKGLSRLSLAAYLCFLASSLFLSDRTSTFLIAAGGLSALFLVLLVVYKKEQRQLKRNRDENGENKK